MKKKMDEKVYFYIPFCSYHIPIYYKGKYLSIKVKESLWKTILMDARKSDESPFVYY